MKGVFMTQETQIPRSEFFERRPAGSATSHRSEVWVAVRKMTKEEAREAYPYRPESKYSESRWGGNVLEDDRCLLISGLALRCSICHAPTKRDSLANDTCPDCDGRAELVGQNPHQKR